MGRIAIDASDAISEIDSFAKKVNNASRKITTSIGKISHAFTGTIKGLNQIGEVTERAGRRIAQGIAIGAAAVGTAAATIGKNALDIRSSIEQGLGGSEAVFEQYAYIIKESSKNAWKSAGLSMEEYLSTANKMGSLFKGSGFSEADAALKTQDAMQRAADVASIMGISVDAAMESIAGMAKGNFTMMDNLGVAMNDTTLEAYRLEKGMAKSVSTMTTAEKVGLAYEMFMERTADYAGNYAKENETAAGSLQTLKAAWSNFLGGVGTFEDLEKSAFGYLNIAAKTMGLDSLEPFILGAQKTVEEVAEILSMDNLDGRQKIAQVRRLLLEKSVSLTNGMGAKIAQGVSSASGIISETLSDINVNLPHFIAIGQDIFDSVRDGVKQASTQLADTAAIIAPSAISNWFTMKTDFIGIGLDILGSISQGISDDLATGPDSQVGAALKNGMHTVLTGLADNLPKMTGLATALIGGIADAMTSEDAEGTSAGEKAGQIVAGIVGKLSEWIDDGGVGKFTSAATSFLLGLGAELVSLAPSVLSGFVSGIWDGLTGILSGVTSFFSDEDLKEAQALKESLDAITKSFDGTEAAIKLATSAYETSMTDLNARLALAEGHLETIKSLENAAELSPDEMSAWQNSVQALVALYPQLGEYVDKETGKFTINSDAIRGNIAALQDLARQKTLQKIQEEYADATVEISKNMIAAQAALTDAEARFNEKAQVKQLLEGRYNNSDWWSGFNTMETALLMKNISGFEDFYDIGLDGSSTVKKYLTEDHQMMNNLYGFLSEANRDYQDAEASKITAEEELAEGKAQLEALAEKANEVAAAFDVVYPPVGTLGDKSADAAGDVNGLGDAANTAADKLSNINPSFAPANVDGSHASGLDFVPKDNYIARLHRGETVLNKEAAKVWRMQQNSGYGNLEKTVAELANAVQELREGFNANMNLYVNKRHVASAMSRDMGRSIGNREYTLMKGMGG